MDQAKIKQIVNSQDRFFKSWQTRTLEFRRGQLTRLKEAIEKYQDEILDAVKKDLGKPAVEAYWSEIATSITEIEACLKKLASWMKPTKVKTPIGFMPGASYVYPEPYGVVLIVAPWNYPFQLLMAPLAGAMAAGNCAVLKPSELSPHTAQVIAKLFREYFEPQYISVVEGGREVSQALLAEKWDYIFFTGSTAVGRQVMEAAAKHLTPVTLELGGKSPCILDRNIPIEVVARRVAYGKWFNAGQTCVAPDYLLLHKDIKDDFIGSVKLAIREFYGDDAHKSPDYGRIINSGHFQRVVRLMKNARILVGGQSDESTRYIAPTVIDQVDWDHPCMQEEIFGPLLPVLEYENLDQAILQINERPKPLALYLFSNDKFVQEKVIRATSSGGVCINDTLSHIISGALPFGGVGASGIGSYHGKASFDTFSHRKSTMKRSLKFDLKERYAPYRMSLRKAKLIFKFVTGL